MQTGHKTLNIYINDLSYNRKILILVLAVLGIFLLSLCIQTVSYGFNSPVSVVANLKAWSYFKLAETFNWPVVSEKVEIINGLETYRDTISRVGISYVTFCCGMLLSLSGNIFQNVFRNPVAAPTMLGAAAGVKLGILLLVLKYGSSALYRPYEKYLYCYIAAMSILLIVMATGKLSGGKKKFSVIDLLIVAAILSQMINGFVTYWGYQLDNDIALVYRQLIMGMNLNPDQTTLVTASLVTVISVVPFYMLRFRFNAVSFGHDESLGMGVEPTGLKVASLVLGSFMVTFAMMYCGTVGMVSLIVPFVSRNLFGVESSKLFWGNLLTGGLFLLVCRDVTSLIPFNNTGFPIGSMVEFITVPVFVKLLMDQRRFWE